MFRIRVSVQDPLTLTFTKHPLTVDEALALIVSYEALLRYPDSPFSAQSLSAVTKLRAALPRMSSRSWTGSAAASPW